MAKAKKTRKAAQARKPAKKAAKKSPIKVAARAESAPKNTFPLTPLSDKVLIRPLTEAEMGTKSPSGIIIPDTATEKADRGIVVSVGAGRWDEDGERRIKMSVAVGDKVIFQWGDKLEFQGTEYYLVSESNISAIIR